MRIPDSHYGDDNAVVGCNTAVIYNTCLLQYCSRRKRDAKQIKLWCLSPRSPSSDTTIGNRVVSSWEDIYFWSCFSSDTFLTLRSPNGFRGQQVSLSGRCGAKVMAFECSVISSVHSDGVPFSQPHVGWPTWSYSCASVGTTVDIA